MPDLTTNAFPDCFVIMPIAEPDGYEKGHFKKVYEDIFRIACEKAGFHAIRADEVKQTNLIHLDILQKLIDSPMAICDLSNRNPNVLFELGLRQAFDKPTVLVQEIGTQKIFDISPLRYSEYRKELRYREVLEDQDFIADAIKATKEATDKGEGVNSIISLLSLSSPASLKDVSDHDSTKMLQIVMSEVNELRTDFRTTMRRIDEREITSRERDLKAEYDYDRLTRDLMKLKKITDLGGSVEEFKGQYEILQRHYLRSQENRLPFNRREQLRLLINEADLLLANYIAKEDK